MKINYFDMSNQTNELKILSMISSNWVSEIIQVSISKGILNFIDEYNPDLKSLANHVNINEALLTRLLKGLEHLSLINSLDGSYVITDLGKLLLPNNQNGFYHMAALWGDEFNHSWSKLHDTLATGVSGFDLFYGKNLFEYLHQNPAKGQTFGLAMHSIAKLLYPKVAELLHLAPNECIADIGGGTGYLISTILNKHPTASGILFDLPDVIAQVINTEHQTERLTVIPGDFFQQAPTANSYILSNVLHDWDNDKAALILSKIRVNQKKGGKIYIVEMVLDHENEPALAISTDLNMLMLTGGKERSLSEFKDILRQAGYQFKSITNVLNMTCLLEASAC